MSDAVMVTGAYGFLGRHVARALKDAGFNVIGLGHGSWSRPEWQEWGLAEWHATDVTLDALCTYTTAAPRAIVHCAGGASVGFSVANPLLDYRRTVESTAAVLEYARTRAPETAVVLPSSGSVYGSPQLAAIPEGSVPAPQSPYAVHKLLAEQLCGEYGRFFGQRVAVVRFFSLYGQGLRKQLLWDACGKLSRGEGDFAGTGDETRDWVHVEDAAALVLLAAQRASPACPIVNGGSGVPISVREALDEVAGALGRGGQARFTGKARPGDPFRFVADPTLARSWGWAPRVAWREGVRAYCKWYREGAP